MARKVLSKEQQKYFGKFMSSPSENQLSEYFLLDDYDLTIINELRTDTNKLGFSIQLGTLRFIETFPQSFEDIPMSVIEYLANQLKVDNNIIEDYFKKTVKNTRTNHIKLIKEKYGYHDFHTQETQRFLSSWLEKRFKLSNERPSVIVDLFLSKCVNKKVVLPGVTVFERFIISIKEKVEKNLIKTLSSIPSKNDITNLLSLLDTPSKNIDNNYLVYRLEDLRLFLETDTQKEIIRGIEKVKQFNQFDVSNWDFKEIPESKIQYYSRLGADLRIQHIKKMPRERQIAILTAYRGVATIC